MESAEAALLKRIRFIARRSMNTQLAGQYHSAFKGNGLAFDSVREYQYGDDVRQLDWNVSARMNHLYIKEYVEEREMSLVILVDVSASTAFRGEGEEKSKRIRELAALFLYLAHQNNDRVSLLLFSSQVEQYIPARKGRQRLLALLRELQHYRPTHAGTDIASALAYASRVTKKRSVVLVISDFLQSGSAYLPVMRRVSRRHEVIPVVVSDPVESDFSLPGFAAVMDMEGRQYFAGAVDPSLGGVAPLDEFLPMKVSTVEALDTAVLRYFHRRNRQIHG